MIVGARNGQVGTLDKRPSTENQNSKLPLLYIVGDSISVHYGPFLQQMVAGVMDYSRKKGDEHWISHDDCNGANGGDSRNVANYLASMLLRSTVRPSVLMLNCGLHDIKVYPAVKDRQVPIKYYRENLQKIVHSGKELAEKVVWVNTTPVDDLRHNRFLDFHRYNADVESYNLAAEEIMWRSSIPIIDLYTFTLNLGKDIYCDYVHFNEHVREAQAAYIAGFLAEV